MRAFMHADHLKLMFPMGWTVATMAWGVLEGKEYLSSQQFDGKSNLAWAIQTLEYGLEFLLDCSFGNGEFVAQVRHCFTQHCLRYGLLSHIRCVRGDHLSRSTLCPPTLALLYRCKSRVIELQLKDSKL